MPSRIRPASLARPLRRCLAECAASPCRTSLSTSTRLRPNASSSPFHTTAAARLPVAVTLGPDGHLALPADYVPPTQPPSLKRPDLRKTQLLRSYTSLLRSTPLMLVFQHSNLTGPEWTLLRRELSRALQQAAESEKAKGIAWPDELVGSIRMQVIRTRMFDVALRITELYDPAAAAAAPDTLIHGKAYHHDLSKTANAAIKKAVAEGAAAPDRSVYGQLQPLLLGPLALLTFPAVSPAHLAAALSVLAPSPPDFPPPTRKKSPSYYEPAVVNAVQKLLLVGGRIDGKAFDADGVRWVGGISGGKAGLQAQLVHLLQSAGLGLTATLEGASKSLWLTMESRKTQLEEKP